LKTLFVIVLIFFSGQSISQAGYLNSDDPILYLFADKQPKLKYEGGLEKYLNDSLKWPKHFDGEGTVLVSFIVSKDGSVGNIKIEKSLCSSCDEEVIRVLNFIPDWEPGEKDSETVDVKLFLPVRFQIEIYIR
jgi:hypothetical protein